MEQRKANINNDFFTRGFYKEPQLISGSESFYKKSCCKLDAYDWLKDIVAPEPQKQRMFVDVRFKNNRKEFFEKKEDLHLDEGDIIAIEASPGHDIGVVAQTGPIVLHQMKKRGINPVAGTLRKVYRKARLSDIEKWITAVKREEETKIASRKIVADLNLQMKINDVEFQGDNTKAIFFYTATERVDFRELIKILAERFKVRIEMKQIGVRQEAGKIGGIGSCGREICCSKWLTDFQSVSTNTARTQQLSLNPQKLAGQCGKLKCCLNFEQPIYEEALKEFPSENTVLQTQNGEARHQKTDIFKKIMWFTYSNDENATLVPIPLKHVKKILQLNQKNKKPESIEMYAIKTEEENHEFDKIVGQDDLNRFDK